MLKADAISFDSAEELKTFSFVVSSLKPHVSLKSEKGGHLYIENEEDKIYNKIL